jgi:hypothetical protein
MRGDQLNRASEYHQNDRYHDGVLYDILAFFLRPQRMPEDQSVSFPLIRMPGDQSVSSPLFRVLLEFAA